MSIILKRVHSRQQQSKNCAEFSREYNNGMVVPLDVRDLDPAFCKWFEAEENGLIKGHIRSILWGNIDDLKATEAMNLWVAADGYVLPSYRRLGVHKQMIALLMQYGLADMTFVEGSIVTISQYYKPLGFTHYFGGHGQSFLLTQKAAPMIQSCGVMGDVSVRPLP